MVQQAPPPDQKTSSFSGGWPEQVAGIIVDTVDRLSRVSYVPLAKLGRAVVYGLMVVVFASTALVLLVILLLRLTDIAFDSVRDWLDNEGPTMWLAYGFWGALFTILGLVFLAKARSATKGS